jgi:hypothetical protein
VEPCPSAAEHPVGLSFTGQGAVNPNPTQGEEPPPVNGKCTEEMPAPGGGSGPTGGGSGGSTPPLDSELPPALGVFAPLIPAEKKKMDRCVLVHDAFALRAGEQNTLTVRVHKNGVRLNYAEVRITGPGVRQTKSTGAGGQATFTVVPAHTGKLYVQTDACTGTDPVPVLAAARAVPPGPPAVTG